MEILVHLLLFKLALKDEIWNMVQTGDLQMKKLPFFLILTITLTVLGGCKEDKPAEVVQTVDWYKTNETARLDVIAKCEANPGQLAATPNCINARTAANHIRLDMRGYQRPPAQDFSKKN
jgi:hypothetical protein